MIFLVLKCTLITYLLGALLNWSLFALYIYKIRVKGGYDSHMFFLEKVIQVYILSIRKPAIRLSVLCSFFAFGECVKMFGKLIKEDL